MEAKIVTMTGCHKCRTLKDLCPDTQCVEGIDESVLLAFARAANLRSLPFLVISGEPDELAKIIKSMN